MSLCQPQDSGKQTRLGFSWFALKEFSLSSHALNNDVRCHKEVSYIQIKPLAFVHTGGVGGLGRSLSLCRPHGRLHGVKVGLFLKLADVFLVADPLVAKPVGHLLRHEAGVKPNASKNRINQSVNADKELDVTLVLSAHNKNRGVINKHINRAKFPLQFTLKKRNVMETGRWDCVSRSPWLPNMSKYSVPCSHAFSKCTTAT